MTRTTHLGATALALLLAGCGSGGGSTADLKVTGTVTASGAPGAQTASVDMTDALTFVPNVVQAKVGTLTLTSENAGVVPHNLVFDDSALGGTETVKAHATSTLTLTLKAPGTFRFTCTFHPGMDGKLVVGS